MTMLAKFQFITVLSFSEGVGGRGAQLYRRIFSDLPCFLFLFSSPSFPRGLRAGAAPAQNEWGGQT